MPIADPALRREHNRKSQVRYQQRHFGKRPSLSRVRADVRLEARAALERLAAHLDLSLTMVIEKLVLAADRRVMGRLTAEARERYCAGGVGRSDIDILTGRARGLTAARESDPTSKNKKPGAQAGRGVESCQHLLQDGPGI